MEHRETYKGHSIFLVYYGANNRWKLTRVVAATAHINPPPRHLRRTVFATEDEAIRYGVQIGQWVIDNPALTSTRSRKKKK